MKSSKLEVTATEWPMPYFRLVHLQFRHPASSKLHWCEQIIHHWLSLSIKQQRSSQWPRTLNQGWKSISSQITLLMGFMVLGSSFSYFCLPLYPECFLIIYLSALPFLPWRSSSPALSLDSSSAVPWVTTDWQCVHWWELYRGWSIWGHINFDFKNCHSLQMLW